MRDPEAVAAVARSYDHAQLAANREEMIVELRARLNVFENRCEVASARLRAALEQGTIRETAEVAEWLKSARRLSARYSKRRTTRGAGRR